MKKMTSLFAALAAVLCVPALCFAAADLSAVVCAPGVEISVEALPPLVVEGTNPPQGVAGAGIVADARAVRVFGGCNFPGKGPADGGKKVYYDAIWTLDLENPVAWERAAEKLPCPAAYGADGVGGENADGKLNVIFPDGNGSFPVKIDNAAGTLRSFVAGGNVDGVPANRAFLRAADGAWEALPDFPGTPRVQPVAGMLRTPRGNAFALVGGFYFDKATKKATLDRAGVIYYPSENKWELLPPLPENVSEAGLVGACAVEDGEGGMLIFGGVNAKIFKDALENPAPDYLRREPAWYKFNADVLRLSFDADGNAKWEKLATVPATARAGASAVRAGDGSIYFVCGELKPGFRSPECVRIRIRTKCESERNEKPLDLLIFYAGTDQQLRGID